MKQFVASAHVAAVNRPNPLRVVQVAPPLAVLMTYPVWRASTHLVAKQVVVLAHAIWVRKPSAYTCCHVVPLFVVARTPRVSTAKHVVALGQLTDSPELRLPDGATRSQLRPSNVLAIVPFHPAAKQ